MNAYFFHQQVVEGLGYVGVFLEGFLNFIVKSARVALIIRL